MRSYITQHPDTLDALCEVHEKTDQAIDVLYGIRDLWMAVPGATYQVDLKNLFGSMAEQIRRKNKSAIKHGMSQIKAVIGSPQIKELLAKQQLPTPIRKQLERPRSDSDSDSSTGSNKPSKALQGQFDALSLELDIAKEQQSIADAKRLEADAKRLEAENELKAEATKRLEAEERAARLEARLAALEGKP